MELRDKILRMLDDPEGLEQLYRGDERAFAAACSEALQERPDSLLLRAWRARLNPADGNVSSLGVTGLALMVFLCLAAGSLLKIPEWLPDVSSYYYPRYMVLIPFSAMLLFTLYLKRAWSSQKTILGITAGMAVYMALVPFKWGDVFGLACLYLPFFLWCLYGVARLSEKWREPAPRIEYLRFFGEACVHAGLLFVGGGVLIALAIGLFSLLNLPTDWAVEYLGVYGLAAIPLVAAWATDTYSAARRLVPLLARIFSPLLLVLIVAYMIAMVVNISELFQDRATLLVYNVLLLSVLGTVVFMLTGRREYGEQRGSTIIVLTMLSATLLLDVVGIVAILWRMYEYDNGLTANRLAVLGSNILVFGNLLLMCIGYIKYWKGTGTLDDIERKIAGYLPVYSGWTAFMIFVVPWVYRY